MTKPVNPAERVLDLLLALVNTPTRMSKSDIRRKVHGYSSDPVAFERTFERDKELLRGLGIPLVTERHALFEDDIGYRVDLEAFRVPASSFTPQELGVLALASKVWRDAQWRGAAESSLMKRRGYGEGSVEDTPPVRLALRTPDSAFDPLLEAIEARRPVSFDYVGLTSPLSRRTVEPWRLVAQRHGWYLVGRDTARGAVRAFRLSRIRSEVSLLHDGAAYVIPDLTADVEQLVASLAPRPVLARLALAPERAALLRARGAARGTVTLAGERREVVEIESLDVSSLAEELAGYGPDAIVLQPEELRADVMARLRGALEGAANAS